MSSRDRPEVSCGVLSFFNDKILVIQQKQGHWTFCKGHMESGETKQQTAERELKEEVRLTVAEYVTEAIFSTSYAIKKRRGTVTKHVHYFVAKVATDEVVKCTKELSDCNWLTIEEAMNQLTFQEDKDLLQRVIDEVFKPKVEHKSQ
eukprot:TRINITY_DN6718_c0_g1_i1.p1 TRINITY_DN6718_c0_g1~~TRINITY_DN6718_c0_g1_i1.p1  ORF type:complete len:157 (-),score=35.06 TRINITY_DN6718_c0_g1_i1:54-494(-)